MFVRGSHTDKFIVKSHFNGFIAVEFEKRKATNKITYSELYEEIAEAVGTNVNTIMGLRKKNMPSLETATAIARHFQVGVEDIWKIEENPYYIDTRERCKEEGCNKLSVGKKRCIRHSAEERRRKEKERKD